MYWLVYEGISSWGQNLVLNFREAAGRISEKRTKKSRGRFPAVPLK